MCLAVNKTKRVKVAKEDIICYKVIKRIGKGVGLRYETPYRDQPIQLRTLYDESNNPMVVEHSCGFIQDWNGDEYKSIHGNAFHSFAKLKDAKWEANDWGTGDDYNMIVVECIIPKGTKYYKGFHGIYNTSIDGYPEGYASEKILYTSTIYRV